MHDNTDNIYFCNLIAYDLYGNKCKMEMAVRIILQGCVYCEVSKHFTGNNTTKSGVVKSFTTHHSMLHINSASTRPLCAKTIIDCCIYVINVIMTFLHHCKRRVVSISIIISLLMLQASFLPLNVNENVIIQVSITSVEH